MKNIIQIYGKHSISEALSNCNRKIIKVLVSNQENFNYVKQIICNRIDSKKLENSIKIVNTNEINSFLPANTNHQGFLVLAEPLNQPSIYDIINNSKKSEKNTLVILDQATDTNNIGAIIRTCAAFNIMALILPKNNSPSETGSIIKSASGAFEKIPYIEVTNIKSTIDLLKKNNFWIVGLDGKSTTTLNKLNTFNNVAFIFGNEGKGLRPLTLKNCDISIKIPINSNNIESLNLSNAVAITLYSRSLQDVNS